MKGLLIAVYGVALATSLLAVRADDAADTTTQTPKAPATAEHKRPVITAEQKAARKELLAKYDTNKDGKLDKEERQKISEEDKAKLKKAGLAQRQRRAVKKDK